MSQLRSRHTQKCQARGKHAAFTLRCILPARDEAALVCIVCMQGMLKVFWLLADQ